MRSNNPNIKTNGPTRAANSIRLEAAALSLCAPELLGLLAASKPTRDPAAQVVTTGRPTHILVTSHLTMTAPKSDKPTNTTHASMARPIQAATRESHSLCESRNVRPSRPTSTSIMTSGPAMRSGGIVVKTIRHHNPPARGRYVATRIRIPITDAAPTRVAIRELTIIPSTASANLT